MGKNMTKNRKEQRSDDRPRYLHAGALLLLLALGVGAFAGLGRLNGNVKPNRDMKWYVREGAVQVAAPAMQDVYTTAEGGNGGGAVIPEETAAEAPAATPAPTATRRTRATAAPLPTVAPEATLEPAAEPVTITITAVGDCTLGGDANKSGYRKFQSAVSKNGYDYFFKNVRSVFEADDLTIVNLEGPLTVSKDKRSDVTYNFKGDPENAAILAGSSVEICNVANNHSLDFGTAGLKETAQVLENMGIGCSGYDQAYYTDVKGVRVGSLGFTKWDHSANYISRAVAEAKENCDLLIVSIHWGVELDYTANKEQQDLGRAAIDAGADLVLGTHPHVLQGIEQYKGKYIVYSLGNFCFGGNANPKDYRTMIFQQAFSVSPETGAADAGINLIPASVSSAKGKNNFQPAVLSAKQGAKVLKLVAKDSRNLSLTDTLWLPHNYMVKAGLMPAEGEDAARTADEAAEAEPDHELTWEEKLNMDV